MLILLTKTSSTHHTITIIRADGSSESVELHTETFFLHDICHYFVEQHMKLDKGFWGMLAQGYEVAELKGKENNLTAELRQTEKVVGSIQSMHWGHMPVDILEANIAATDFEIDAAELTEAVLPQIKALMDEWKYLPAGGEIKLQFSLRP